jgi:NAD(P)-dependent dehydrogenase (short-subunit alcohol dehydrogenase family)
MPDTKVALVTGTSSGFGELTAALLAKKGYRVFGTSRRERPAAPQNVEMLVLDVRSNQSVHACVEKFLSLTNRIDLLVNNAGQAHAGVIEETSLAQATDVFETNFWGAVRVTGAVLPFMRQQRSGQIINVSSLAGLMGVVGQGFYSASKFALEGYSEALSLEVGQFNIKVSLIEPGFFKTNLHQAMSSGTNVLADYKALRNAVESSFKQAILHGNEPAKVAQMIVRVAESKSPRLRYRVGSDALWVPRLKAILPASLFRLGIRRRFNLP